MANTPKRMQQIRLILQAHAKGQKIRAISRQLKISRNTVKDYLRRCERYEGDISVLLGLSDEELSSIAYGQAVQEALDERRTDFDSRVKDWLIELGKVGVTRQLLWQEYRQVKPDGYSYTQFCHYLREHVGRQDVVMHFEHKAGDRLMIDFAGKELCYTDPGTGEVIKCPVLVAVLPFSGYSYVEALPSQRQEDFLRGIANAFAYVGGVTACALIDNLKSGVKRANRYERVFTDLLEQMSLHYDCTFMATRVRKPRDKPHVEREVQLVYQRVFAPLRDQQFTSIAAINQAIGRQLIKHHQLPFQRKAGGNRQDLFEEHERPLLSALPKMPFEVKYTIKAQAQRNYHIVIGQDWHYYSVPYEYAGKSVQVVYTSRDVEVYYQHQRIAFHKRNRRKYGYTTLPEHMPSNHRHYLEQRGWTAEYFLDQARQIGPSCLSVIEQMLTAKIFIEQTYNSCLGVIRLTPKYAPARLEAACRRALRGCRVNYTIVHNILKNNLDKLEQEPESLSQIPEHDNIRGPEAYC